MRIPFILALSTFAFCFGLHAVVWRIFKPQRYLLWLPSVFFGTPVIGWLVFVIGFEIALPDCGYCTIILTSALYIPLVICYTGGYAGIVEYSPSAEILRVVSDYPNGIAPSDLCVSSLNESALTGKRLRHLQLNQLIVSKGDGLFLTGRGLQSTRVCKIYRRVFGIKEEASG